MATSLPPLQEYEFGTADADKIALDSQSSDTNEEILMYLMSDDSFGHSSDSEHTHSEKIHSPLGKLEGSNSDFSNLTPSSSPRSFENGIEPLPPSPSDAGRGKRRRRPWTARRKIKKTSVNMVGNAEDADASTDSQEVICLTAEEVERLRVKERGFCVICEMHCEDIKRHLRTSHRQNFNAYTVQFFRRFQSQILKPKLTDTDELGQCRACLGVFFTYRVQNHTCPCQKRDPNWFGEDLGPEYCLMCQSRSKNVDYHRASTHYSLHAERYVIREVDGLRTLVPADTDVRADDVEHHPKCCRFCLPFTYKNRRRRICERQKRMLDRFYTYQLMTFDHNLQFAADHFNSY